MKGLRRSLARGEPQDVLLHKVVIKVRDLAITVDGATGVGWGTAVAGDFPEGNILYLGGVAYLQFAGPTSGDLDDDWAGDYGVGTTPASDGTLTGGDVDLVASTALAAATAEVSPRTRGVNATQAIFDNTANALEVNVSLLVDDANIGADGLAFTANGEIFLVYTVLGDD